ncbi:MAG: CopD family protein [Pseudomonadota bacterium]|mgnify:CR=1 FL=1
MIDDPVSVAITASELVILAAAMGAIAGGLWILPPGNSAAAQQDVLQLRHRLGKLLGACLIALTFTSFAGLLLRTASMSELPVWSAFPALGTVLFKTHYGQLWLWRAAALLALWIFWALQKRNPPSRRMAAGEYIALVIIIFTLSGSGHPGDDGLLSLSNLANTLHIIGAFLWGGGIIAMMVIILPALLRSRTAARELIALTSLRLSTLAGIALAMVLVPGIYNAWLLVGSWQGLWGNPYGQLLLVKIALAGAMAGLGALNRYVYVPAIQRHAGLAEPRSLLPLPRFMHTHDEAGSPKHFLKSLRVEAALLIGVLIFAAALSQQTPAAHADHEMAEHTSPASE